MSDANNRQGQVFGEYLLKPGNVWLTRDGVAKIGDFGLAVARDRSRLTTEGMMVGTLTLQHTVGRPGPEVPGISNLYLAGDWVGPEGWLSDASRVRAKRAAECILGAGDGLA